MLIWITLLEGFRAVCSERSWLIWHSLGNKKVSFIIWYLFESIQGLLWQIQNAHPGETAKYPDSFNIKDMGPSVSFQRGIFQKKKNDSTNNWLNNAALCAVQQTHSCSTWQIIHLYSNPIEISQFNNIIFPKWYSQLSSFEMNVFQGSLNMKPWRCIFSHKLDFIDNEMVSEAVVGACMSIEKQWKSVRVQQDFRYTKWLLIQRGLSCQSQIHSHGALTWSPSELDLL